MDNVDVRAFAMPERYRVAGKIKVPVVVMLDQGATPAGNGNDDALVPVGAAGALAIGAGDFTNSANWTSNPTRDKPGDDKRYPVRIFHLVDASPSMSEYSGAGSLDDTNTKLKLVQDTISRLADNLPDGIKHVLIPYSDQLHSLEAGAFDQPAALVAAIKRLTTRGGTDIGVPIAEALRQIKKSPNSDEGIEYRNLINLISDGQAGITEPLEFAKTYPDHNAGAFSLGVGPGYNETLMHGVVENAGFGGFAHIPQTGKQQVIDVFGKILPDVISQMMSAPYYPVIKFNKWFDSVINMTPSTREVGVDKVTAAMAGPRDDFFKYRAAVGYQNRGFAVGFIDEDKLDQAIVHLEINESASKDPLETEELIIEDFNALGLDLKDIELLRNAPLEALKMQIIKERDPTKIKRFIEENPDIDQAFKQRLEELADQLQHYAAAGDDNASMTVTGGDQSFSFTSMTRGDTPFAPGDDSAVPLVSPDDNTAGALGGDAYTQLGRLPVARVVPADKPDLKTPGEITLKFTPINSKANMIKNGVVCDEFSIKPNQRLNFGRRGRANDIHLQGTNEITREHGYFILDNGNLFIVDNGSTHGTKINDGSNISPNAPVRVRPEDIISIAGNTFRISFQQNG